MLSQQNSASGNYFFLQLYLSNYENSNHSVYSDPGVCYHNRKLII